MISTLVHEAAHHTGPSDVTYNPKLMRQNSQADQLNNAGNFEYFSQETANAAWGCVDNDPPNVNFQCSGGACACTSLGSYCQDATYGATLRRECAATCGVCNSRTPAPSPPPQPSPATPAPSPSPPSGCGDSASPSFPFSCNGRACTCAGLVGYCQDATYGATVRSQCAGTCGACGGSTPSRGCGDKASPSFPFSCGSGRCTCAGLRGYCQDSNYGPSIRGECAGTCGLCSSSSCADKSSPSFPFTCNGGTCTCAGLAGYCQDSTYGPPIRGECPATCGACSR